MEKKDQTKFDDKAREILDKKDKFKELEEDIINKKESIADPYLKQAHELKASVGKESLGKVNVLGQGNKELESADMLLGWHHIYINELPSTGKFYPVNIKILIRSAKVNEVRHWSTLNDRDIFDIEDKLNYMLQSCMRISSDGKLMSWKDIREEDKIFVLLKIRDLTFPEPESKLQFKKKCPDCGTELTIEIKPASFGLNKIPENIEKYYSEEERCYVIQTKSSGIIRMAPPSIGVMKVLSEYVDKKTQAGEGWDKAWTQVLPYMQLEWRGFKEKNIFDGEVDFKSWDIKKYNIIYNIAEKMKIGVKPNIVHECTECGAEVTTKVDFPGGIKGLFMLPDISSELF
jgi:rRNA maturation protein Nop10